MLQFEYDIRDYKAKTLKSHSQQLIVGVASIFFSILLYFFTKHLESNLLFKYIALSIGSLALVYTLGIIWGCKFMYPREYLRINSRKIKYKFGWFTRRTRIYRTDVKKYKIENYELIIITKELDEYRVSLKDFSDEAILVLKSYLNIMQDQFIN